MSAAITAVAVGVAGSAYAASEASKSADAATSANSKNAKNTNLMNYKLFREGRGRTTDDGYTGAILPEYFKGQEASLADAANAQYGSITAQNAGLVSNLQGQLALSNGAQQSAFNALFGRYNGANQAQYLGNAQPTYDARLNLARSQMSGIDTGLAGVIGQLNASRAAQGFLGGSTFDRSRLLASTIGARQQAGNAYGGALLANAEDERLLRDSDLAGRQDFSPLNQGFQNWSALQAAPLQQQVAGYQAAMSPYSFFRIGQNSFQQAPMPTVGASMSNGQIAGQALSSLGGVGLNYALQSRLQSQYGQQTPLYSPQVPANTFNNNSLNAPVQNPNQFGTYTPPASF